MIPKGIVRAQKVASVKVELSREMRKNMTKAEKKFWQLVRGRKFNGLKFRRQQIIDGFIVDFYCDSAGLCVEIDGSIHDLENQNAYDRQRDLILSLKGLKILRLSNDEVLNNTEVVLKKLDVAVKK